MSLALDYPYNQIIAKKLSQYTPMWEPFSTSQIKGGNMYVLPGSSAAYPMFNMVEQDLIDRGKMTKRQTLKGNARKFGKQSEVASDVAQAIESSGSELSGGAIDFKKIKRVATPILKLAASRGLDVGLPALGASVSTFLGGDPAIGRFVGKLGRDIIKQQTGFGRKNQSGKQSEVASDVAQAIESSMGGSELSGGAIDWKKIKRVATPILKKAASKGLDIGLPALGASVSTFLGGNPLVGAFVGKLGRDILKQQTGFGRKLSRTTDVAEYKGGSHYKKKAPQRKAPQKGAGHKAKPKNAYKNTKKVCNAYMRCSKHQKGLQRIYALFQKRNYFLIKVVFYIWFLVFRRPQVRVFMIQDTRITDSHSSSIKTLKKNFYPRYMRCLSRKS